ncbi:putative UDP-arabinose 4-epimerase 3 [Glycine soja]
MPIFDGEDLMRWLTKIERYFRLLAVREENKLEAIMVAMDGEALGWFQWWESWNPIHSWDGFKIAVTQRLHEPKNLVEGMVKARRVEDKNKVLGKLPMSNGKGSNFQKNVHLGQNWVWDWQLANNKIADPTNVDKDPLDGKTDKFCVVLVLHPDVSRIFAIVGAIDSGNSHNGTSYGEKERRFRYYHNITSNTLLVLESMAKYGVKTLIYSSTCATYGEPEKMPIIEITEQKPINPYGKAKKMAEDIIFDFSKNSKMAVMILRYFNVIGSDPEGRLGEAPRPELREHGRISGACFDAARGITTGLKVRGTDYKTPDGTCIRDYIDVTDLVDAHVKALEKAQPGKVGIYNVGTGKGRSVKEFVNACKKATGVDIKVDYLPRRPGDYAEVYSDPSKINRELNWTAQYTDLEKSLQVAWKWQKSHRNGYGILSAI